MVEIEDSVDPEEADGSYEDSSEWDLHERDKWLETGAPDDTEDVTVVLVGADE